MKLTFRREKITRQNNHQPIDKHKQPTSYKAKKKTMYQKIYPTTFSFFTIIIFSNILLQIKSIRKQNLRTTNIYTTSNLYKATQQHLTFFYKKLDIRSTNIIYSYTSYKL